MTPEEFVRELVTVASDGAAEGVVKQLRKPSGRTPEADSIRRSEWYNSLDQHDQRMIYEIALEAARLCLFSTLCVIDGVATVEGPGPKGQLRLTYSKDGTETILGGTSIEPMLHDLFSEVEEEQRHQN